MPSSLLWINKNAKSSRLSQSTGKDETAIRRHVQRQRQSRKNALDSTAVVALNDIAKENRLDDEYEQRCHELVLNSLHWTVCIDLTAGERRSFHFFVNRTGKAWTGWQDDLFWNDMALKLCHTSPAVLHSLISLASFHESLSVEQHSSHALSLAAQSHVQSSRAIAAAINNTNMTHLEALVSCIAILCVQNLQKSCHRIQLLLSGAKLLDDCQRLAKTGDISASHLHSINLHIRPLFDRMRSRLCMINDPIYVLQNTIRSRSLEIGTTLPALLAMPSTFQSLFHARNCLDEILYWALDVSAATYKNSCPIETVNEICQTWYEALETMRPLFKTQQDLAMRHFLRVACLFGQTILGSLHFTSEMDFDNHICVFREIIELIEDALKLAPSSDNGHQASFGIDDGLIDILAFVSLRCRDPVLRRRAYGLMIHGGRKEGGRLAFTAGIISQVLAHKEECGLDNISSAQEIPDSRRWKLMQGEQYFGVRKIRLTFARSTSGDEEQIWIDLPEGIDIEHDSIKPPANHDIRDLSTPETIFGRGYTAFLRNRATKKYDWVRDRPFCFPIPRA